MSLWARGKIYIKIGLSGMIWNLNAINVVYTVVIIKYPLLNHIHHTLRETASPYYQILSACA